MRRINKWLVGIASGGSSMIAALTAFAQTPTTPPSEGTVRVTTWYTEPWAWAVGIGVAVFLIVVIALTNRGGTRPTT
jgi:hypothetical protein